MSCFLKKHYFLCPLLLWWRWWGFFPLWFTFTSYVEILLKGLELSSWFLWETSHVVCLRSEVTCFAVAQFRGFCFCFFHFSCFCLAESDLAVTYFPPREIKEKEKTNKWRSARSWRVTLCFPTEAKQVVYQPNEDKGPRNPENWKRDRKKRHSGGVETSEGGWNSTHSHLGAAQNNPSAALLGASSSTGSWTSNLLVPSLLLGSVSCHCWPLPSRK